MIELVGLTTLAALAAAWMLARSVRRSSPVAVAAPPEPQPQPIRPPSISPDAHQRVDPLLILRQAADGRSAQARAAGVTVFAPPPGSGFRLETRPAVLTQILDALFENAVRHNRPGGTVLAELRQTADGLAFRIHDTGPGLTPEARRRLFEPAADAADCRLPRAWRLARTLGGRLSAAATLGEGSTFTLVLPTAPGRDRHASALPSLNPRLSSAVLLLIEPDPAFAALMRHVAAGVGAALHVSSSGEEGLTLARDLRPDAILTETCLPGLSGAALQAALHADPLTRDIPVVAFCAEPDPALALAGRRAGFAAWLSKPLDIPFFVLTLNRILAETAEPARIDRRVAARGC